MKIVNIITALGYGGAERLLQQVYGHLAQRPGVQLHVIYLKDLTPLMASFPRGVRFHYVPLGKDCAAHIRTLLQELKPDVVHTHLGHADLLGLWACRGLPIRTFCTMHNIWFKFSPVDYGIFAAYRLLFATVARRTTVICISKVVQRHVRRWLGVGRSRSPLLYNGIAATEGESLSKVQARQRLNIPLDGRVVLFVGRLEKQKNVPVLLQALAQLKDQVPKLNAYIIGEGSMRESLLQQRRELGLEQQVSLPGTVADVSPWMAAADILALPSLFEGLGIVIIEAFRAGLPVVASRIEGPQELIQPMVNGLLVTPNDADALAGGLADLLLDPALANEMSLNALDSFGQQFDVRNYAQRLWEMYKGD